MGTLPAHLTLRANVSGSPGSVRFALNGNAAYSTENAAPCSLGGDTNGNFNAWNLALGVHRVTATPWSGSAASGVADAGQSISFTLVRITTLPSLAQVVAHFGSRLGEPLYRYMILLRMPITITITMAMPRICPWSCMGSKCDRWTPRP